MTLYVFFRRKKLVCVIKIQYFVNQMAIEQKIIGGRPRSWVAVTTKSFCALRFFQKPFISTPANAIYETMDVFMSSFENKKSCC